MKNIFTTLLAALLLLGACAAQAQTIRRVNNTGVVVTGVNVYTTLQAAHDAASSGNIIYLEPSNISSGALACVRPLTIIGNDYCLTLTSAYVFTMSPGYTGQRFYLWPQAGGILSTATGALQAATHLYPNPITSTTILEMAGLTAPGPVQLELLNPLGQVVPKRTAQPRAGILREELDLANLAAGVYSVRVLTPQGTVVKRLTRE